MSRGEGTPESRSAGPPRPPSASHYPEVVTRTRNPVRRVFHFLVALAGWVLFVIFWYEIFLRNMGGEALTTGLLLVVVVVGIIFVNFLWVSFNVGIYRTRGNRTQVRHVPFRARRDVLGRALDNPDWSILQETPLIEVTVDQKAEVKTYAAVEEGSGEGETR